MDKGSSLFGPGKQYFQCKIYFQRLFYTYDDDFSNPGTVITVEGAGYYPQATINFFVGGNG
ncbi:MAG: hypothetical protein KDC94_11490 [Aequorivita sp.]|nr:hypothetical protein [Aequorivita sp.]MCB0455555.1 hypothetical protein [Aequorivita sp.]MCB0467520.1 hypothetical protein [Aequorivita sp.]HPE83582.1 hypothetical protein [Aequorivita sp.]